MNQTNIFEFIYPKYHCTKPIRLIELFAGYGSQALALKYLGVPFEHWKICEWNYKSFHAYKLLHSSDDTDYSKGLSKDELVEYLAKKGVSADWNKPMKLEQIKRLGEGSLREIYNNIQATHNLVDVSQVHGNDLEIINPDQYTYIMTYSFPCQDLSLAGLRQGMNRGEETRSGLLWEVERILHELRDEGNLPDILLMENVPQVHGAGNEENFREWQLVLERIGYSNYWQDLIATDYGIPQIRNRCFMVSIKGEYYYNFPSPIPLRKKLSDLLEKNVGEQYFISQEMIEGMKKTSFNSYSYDNQNMTERESIKTLTTATGERAPLFIEVGEGTKMYNPYNKAEITDVAPTQTTNCGNPNSSSAVLIIKNATKQGFLEAEAGDGVDISGRMEYHRGTVQKGLSQTLNTSGGGSQGVVIKYE